MIRSFLLFFYVCCTSLAVAANPYFDVKRGYQQSEFYQSVSLFKDCQILSLDTVVTFKQGSFTPLNEKYFPVLSNDNKCFYWLHFKLMNSSPDNRRIFYSSGFSAMFEAFEISKGKVVRLPEPKYNYLLLEVRSGDTVDVYVRNNCSLPLTRQYIYPKLIDIEEMVENNPAEFLSGKSTTFYYFMILFTGMSLMLGIYLFILFFQLWDFSYLLYSLNIFCIVALVAIRVIYIDLPENNYFIFYAWLIPMLQILSHLFYFLFASHFLNMKEHVPELHRFINYVVVFLVIYLVVDYILFLTGNYHALRMQIFFWLRIVLILAAFGSIIYAHKRPTLLLRLFTFGTCMMVVSATISFIMSYNWVSVSYGLWSVPFFYFLLGYLIDHVFFTICLGYKNRQEQLEHITLERELVTQRAKERENYLQLIMHTQEQERNRMAEDLHDELGSGLSTIRFLIESMKLKGESVSPKELHFISLKSAEIIENMRQIIWAVNPEHDNLADLLFYMKRYTGEYLETNKIDWDFNTVAFVPDKKLPPGLRRNLFAILKEALHNVSKHANATNVVVSFEYQQRNESLECVFKIKDNGKGFDVCSVYSGNGLKNMVRRMKETGGGFQIQNNNPPETGIVIALSFNIP